jgi:hypothetical protein
MPVPEAAAAAYVTIDSFARVMEGLFLESSFKFVLFGCASAVFRTFPAAVGEGVSSPSVVARGNSPMFLRFRSCTLPDEAETIQVQSSNATNA